MVVGGRVSRGLGVYVGPGVAWGFRVREGECVRVIVGCHWWGVGYWGFSG